MLIDRIKHYLKNKSLKTLSNKTGVSRRTLIALTQNKSKPNLSTAISIAVIVCDSKYEIDEVLTEYRPYSLLIKKISA